MQRGIERQVRAAFGADAPAALTELATYGVEEYHREPDRVRRAIVTLAKGDLSELRHLTAAARRDYRDVLMWAEYPEAARDVTEADVRALLRWANERGDD